MSSYLLFELSSSLGCSLLRCSTRGQWFCISRNGSIVRGGAKRDLPNLKVNLEFFSVSGSRSQTWQVLLLGHVHLGLEESIMSELRDSEIVFSAGLLVLR